jgi:hypothetical protein
MQAITIEQSCRLGGRQHAMIAFPELPRCLRGLPAKRTRDEEHEEILREKERYERQVAIFNDYASQFDVPGLNKFFWYHSVDLEDGIVTPGDYDYRYSLDAFQFPDDMRGMKVLDVGSATGFFAFEFER